MIFVLLYIYSGELLRLINSLLLCTAMQWYSILEVKFVKSIIERLPSVYFSELLGGEIRPAKNSQISPKILRHVMHHTFNTNTSPSKFACCLAPNIGILE